MRGRGCGRSPSPRCCSASGCCRLEARLGFSGWRRRSVAGDGAPVPTESGIGDISVGFKTRVLAARAGLPEIAFIGTLLLPTGREGLGAERVEPEARLALAHDLSQRVSLGYNVAATWNHRR